MYFLCTTGIRPELEVFTLLMKSCASLIAPNDALLVLKRMEHAGYQVDGAYYSCALHIFAAAGDLNQGKVKLQQLQKGTTSSSSSKDRTGWTSRKDSSKPDGSAAIRTRSKVGFSYEKFVSMFEMQLPGLCIDTVVSCPGCQKILQDMDIRQGWSDSSDDYTTRCSACGERFVARFVVRQTSIPRVDEPLY